MITSAARRYLDESGFFEIETPILSNPTPEGARDFLVPSRLNPGRFYALPQAPQQYKQLMMVAGLEKYYQIARCFRDEDLRADRQPEFTQIDLEASFVGQEDIIQLVEGLLASMFKAGLGIDVPTPFPRMTYREAEDIYGSDKPDTRYDMRIIDLADVFATTEFKIFRSTLDGGGVVSAINAKGFAGITTGQMNRLNEIAIQAGLPVKTLAFIKCEGGEYKSPLWKFFTDAEKDALVAKMDVEEGDIVFFVAGARESVSTILGRVRVECANMMELTKDSTAYNFLWVVDFPLLALDEETGHWGAVHHPFTRPHPDDVAKLDAGDYANVRAVAYDVVLNGYELGGGSIRIHEKDLQAKMFERARRRPGGTADQVRPHSRCLPLRRAAARRSRARARPHRHARRRRRQHPRGDRLPEKQQGRGPDGAKPLRDRLQGTARSLHPVHLERSQARKGEGCRSGGAPALTRRWAASIVRTCLPRQPDPARPLKRRLLPRRAGFSA